MTESIQEAPPAAIDNAISSLEGILADVDATVEQLVQEAITSCRLSADDGDDPRIQRLLAGFRIYLHQAYTTKITGRLQRLHEMKQRSKGDHHGPTS